MIEIKLDTREGTGWDTWKYGHNYMRMFSERFSQVTKESSNIDPMSASVYQLGTIGPSAMAGMGFFVSNGEMAVGVVTPLGNLIFYIATASAVHNSRQFTAWLKSTDIPEFNNPDFINGMNQFSNDMEAETNKIAVKPLAFPSIPGGFQGFPVMQLTKEEFDELANQSKFLYGVSYMTDMDWINTMLSYYNTFLPQSPLLFTDTLTWDNVLFSKYRDFIQNGNKSEPLSRVLGKSILLTNGDVYYNIFSQLGGDIYKTEGFKKGYEKIREVFHNIASKVEI